MQGNWVYSWLGIFKNWEDTVKRVWGGHPLPIRLGSLEKRRKLTVAGSGAQCQPKTGLKLSDLDIRPLILAFNWFLDTKNSPRTATYSHKHLRLAISITLWFVFFIPAIYHVVWWTPQSCIIDLWSRIIFLAQSQAAIQCIWDDDSTAHR